MDRTSYTALALRLMDGPCLLADFLPRQVPAEAGGRFFTVEQWFLAGPRLKEQYRRFCRLLLKLYCYYPLALSTDGGEAWIDMPEPDALEKAVCARIKPCADLWVLLPSEGVLFTLSSGDLHMTVYGAAGQAERTLRQLAAGEGLYVWAHGEE